MNNSVFGTTPKIDGFKIPFKLKEDALLEWLLGLSKYGARGACSSILQLLQALNKTNLPAKTRSSFLKISHEYLKQYISQLDGSCWDASLPLSSKERTYAEAVVWNYLALAEGFLIVAQDSGIRADEMFALYMTCYSLGQAQLHTAAVYARPDEVFWQLVYKTYAWGEKYKLLQTAINSSNLKEVSLNCLFAQIIIFQNCDTTQFRPRDMLTIFNFLPKVCGDFAIYKLSDVKFQTDVLQIPYLNAVSNRFGNSAEKLAEKINAREDLFIFDINEADPPSLYNQTHSLAAASLRYFTVAMVVENLEQILDKGEMWSGTLKSMNHELFGRVSKTLETGKKRKHARLQTEQSMLGVIGFENIVAFLYKVNKKSTLKPAPAPVVKKNPTSYEELKFYADQSQMGAIDGGFAEVNYSYSSMAHSAIWEDKNVLDISHRPVSLKKLTVFDSSARGYSVYWPDNENSKTKISDLFAIISADKKRLEIAIIRRIAMTAENDYKFGAEVLGFESEAVIITHANNQNSVGWGVFIPGTEVTGQVDTVIYQIGHFHPGDFIYIHRQDKKIKAAIAKELNATSAIAHVEISYSVDLF